MIIDNENRARIYREYVAQIKAMPREQVESLAICALMELFANVGGDVEIAASEYYFANGGPNMWPVIVAPKVNT